MSDISDAQAIQEAVIAFRDAIYTTGRPLSDIWEEADYDVVEHTLNAFSTNNRSVSPRYPFEFSFDEQITDILIWCDAVIEQCEEIITGDAS